MSLRMLDSIYPSRLPAGADAYLGYVDGRWATYPALKNLFPHAHILSVAVFPADDAEGCDCETGDLTVTDVPAWVRRQHARGITRPVVYASAGIMQSVISALAAAGITRTQVRLLSAHYGQGKHICGPGSCGYPQADGTQWTDTAAGNGGTLIDESELSSTFFGPPLHITALEDDVILDNLPQGGPAVALAVPAGKTHLVLAADEYNGHVPPQLRVGFGSSWGGAHTVDVDWQSSPKAVTVPAGSTVVTIARLDAGNTPVSAAWA